MLKIRHYAKPQNVGGKFNKGDSMEKQGFIYIMTNPSLKEDYYKIGKTSRTPEERANELSKGTGVAEPFQVVHSRKFRNCNVAETIIHERLGQYRFNSDREFFKVSLHTAVHLVDDLAIKDLEEQLQEKVETENKLIEIRFHDIETTWHNFFLSLNWDFQKNSDFNKLYSVSPSFFLKTFELEINEEGDRWLETTTMVFLLPDIDIKNTSELVSSKSIEKIESLYREIGQPDDNFNILLLGKTLISEGHLSWTGLGWIGCHHGWELARFTQMPNNDRIKYGILNDHQTWTDRITGKYLSKDNIFFKEEPLKQLWTRIETSKKPYT